MAITLPPNKTADAFIAAADVPTSADADESMVVTFTASKAFVARFDELVKQRGISRAAYIKLLMADAIRDAERRGDL